VAEGVVPQALQPEATTRQHRSKQSLSVLLELQAHPSLPMPLPLVDEFQSVVCGQTVRSAQLLPACKRRRRRQCPRS